VLIFLLIPPILNPLVCLETPLGGDPKMGVNCVLRDKSHRQASFIPLALEHQARPISIELGREENSNEHDRRKNRP
jgi:hypothetical protein